MSAGFAFFATALGRCALAWRGEQVTRVRLPGDEAAIRLSLEPLGPEAPPPASISAVAQAIAAHLSGEVDNLQHVPVALDACSDFDRSVYAATRAIPPGETRTYGQLAAAAGQPRAAQAAGLAMARNPCPIVIPCHRVMGADGRLVGFSAPGGLATKVRLLEIERAAVGGAPTLFDDLPLAVRP